MKDFIYKLYNNDNFTLYLTIILIILVILFFIVLFFGKKDKKLQETKKLELSKVKDTFKEEEKKEKVEVEGTLIPEPTEVTEIIFNPEEKAKEEVSEKEVEINTEELENHFDELSNALEKDLSDLENIKKEFDDIELPKLEEKKEEKVVEKPSPQVFSSVFAPKKEVDDLDMELPVLKKKEEPKVEENNNDLNNNFDFNSLEGESYDLNK